MTPCSLENRLFGRILLSLSAVCSSLVYVAASYGAEKPTTSQETSATVLNRHTLIPRFTRGLGFKTSTKSENPPIIDRPSPPPLPGQKQCFSTFSTFTYKSFSVSRHKDSKGRWKVGLPSLLWYSAQLGQQCCQVKVPDALYHQGNSLVSISVRGWVDPRATECG